VGVSGGQGENQAARRGALLALEAVVRQRDAAEAAIPHAVERAREAGATWDDIAGLVGMTRQGASQRFRAKQAERDLATPAG
jgi:hypothetical protein